LDALISPTLLCSVLRARRRCAGALTKCGERGYASVDLSLVMGNGVSGWGSGDLALLSHLR
jgi:hypothetical protein